MHGHPQEKPRHRFQSQLRDTEQPRAPSGLQVKWDPNPAGLPACGRVTTSSIHAKGRTLLTRPCGRCLLALRTAVCGQRVRSEMEQVGSDPRSPSAPAAPRTGFRSLRVVRCGPMASRGRWCSRDRQVYRHFPQRELLRLLKFQVHLLDLSPWRRQRAPVLAQWHICSSQCFTAITSLCPPNNPMGRNYIIPVFEMRNQTQRGPGMCLCPPARKHLAGRWLRRPPAAPET